MADLITKLLPILHVDDPGAERRFYEQLGLRTTYEGPEYPDFIAVGNDAVEFGLSRRPGADAAASGLTWQLGVSDVDAAIAACQRAGVGFEVTTERPGAQRHGSAARRTVAAFRLTSLSVSVTCRLSHVRPGTPRRKRLFIAPPRL
jgi:hypothetical protein